MLAGGPIKESHIAIMNLDANGVYTTVDITRIPSNHSPRTETAQKAAFVA